MTVFSEDSEVIMFRADDQNSFNGEEKNVPLSTQDYSPSKLAKKVTNNSAHVKFVHSQ